MNDHERQILDDILNDVAPPEYQQHVLSSTLAAARSRKRNKIATRYLVLAIAIGLTLFSRQSPRTGKILETKSSFASIIVESRPVPPGMVVQTQSHFENVISSSVATVTIIESRPAQELFRFINDTQLLASLEKEHAILVRYQSGETEVVIPIQDGIHN